MQDPTMSYGATGERPAGAEDANAWRYWVEGGLIVAFWACLFMLTVGRRAIDPRGPAGIASNELLQIGLEYGVWLCLTPGIFWLSRRFSLERGVWPRHLALHVGAGLVVATAMNTFGHTTFHALVLSKARPFSFLKSFISLGFLDELITYLTVLAAGFARDYFLRYRERRQEATELRAQAAQLHASLAEARLEALRMQINPHFLFNTLHAISSLVERDPRGVRRMIARLSELLRYTLERTSSQEVTLREELQFLNGYLDIQRIRFQGKLEVQEIIEPDALEALVPNLILQPLVENAIKHGVNQVYEAGHIEIRAWREERQLYMSVRDDGPGFGEPRGDGSSGEPHGVGLRNTRARLEGLYGSAQSLTLESAEGGGTVARIALPYHTGADLRTTSIPSE